MAWPKIGSGNRFRRLAPAWPSPSRLRTGHAASQRVAPGGQFYVLYVCTICVQCCDIRALSHSARGDAGPAVLLAST